MIGPRRRSGRRRPAAVALAATLLAATVSWASPPAPGRVVLLDPAEASPTAHHCLTRIHEELVAGGYEVATVDPGPVRDPVAIAGAMEQQQGAVAVVAFVGDPDRAGTELWILDRVGTSPEVRRVPTATGDSEHLAEVLAIRTVEVLRASALKLLVESSRGAPALAPTDIVAAPAAVPRPRTIGLETGLSMVENIGGPGLAAVPLIRGRARLGDWLSGRLTLAGLGSRPQVVTPMIGSASVAQSFGLAELAVAYPTGRAVRPVLTLGAGAFYVQSDGAGIWPYVGQRSASWAAAADVGTGVLASVGTGLAVGFEVHGLLALPHPAVRFNGVEAATIGYPALLASLTMVAWL